MALKSPKRIQLRQFPHAARSHQPAVQILCIGAQLGHITKYHHSTTRTAGKHINGRTH